MEQLSAHLGPQEQEHIHPLEVSDSKASWTQIATKTLAQQNPIAEKPQHEWGEVVVLVGTSTAGKSSIISELIKQQPQMVEHGVDMAGVNIPLSYLNTNHPQEMAYLRQMIDIDIKQPGLMLDYIIFEQSPNFKTNVTNEEKLQCTEIIKKMKESLLKEIPDNDTVIKLMMDQVLLDSKRGSPVVFDVLHINEIANHTLITEKEKNPPVKIALVYVPFQTLAERIAKRNDEAVESNQFFDARPGLFPLQQFAKIFRPKRDEGEEVIQTITLKEAQQAIDRAYASGKAFLEKYEPQHLGRLEQDKAESGEKILKKLGFEVSDTEDKTVQLTPRFKGYHMLINTAQTGKSKTESVQESIQQILFKSK